MAAYSVIMRCAPLALLAMTGCGGSGGGNGSLPVTPSPAPTPTPSPMPTATPTPTPSAAFVTALGGPIVGSITFDINNDGIFGNVGVRPDGSDTDVTVTTNRSGEFGQAAVGRLNNVQPPADASYAFTGGGVDAASGYLYTGMRAPAGATTLSPVTTLLRSISDDVVAANTGLAPSARQLATFAAAPALSSADTTVAAAGRRITAFNLKLAALAAFAAANQAILEDAAIGFDGSLTAVQERLISGPVDLNDEATIRAILDRTSGALGTSAEGRAAIAQLLARYGAAVDAYLTGRDRVASVQHGLRLVVLPEIVDILRTNVPDTTVARGKTTDALIAAFAGFADIPAPSLTAPADASGNLVAATDFRSIGRFTVNDTLTLDTNCNGANQRSPVCNDPGIGSGVGITATALRVTAVRLPASFSGQIDVVLASDGRIVMRRLNGATGLVWFEYDVLAQSGLRATGRVYVRLGGQF